MGLVVAQHDAHAGWQQVPARSLVLLNWVQSNVPAGDVHTKSLPSLLAAPPLPCPR